MQTHIIVKSIEDNVMRCNQCGYVPNIDEECETCAEFINKKDEE